MMSSSTTAMTVSATIGVNFAVVIQFTYGNCEVIFLKVNSSFLASNVIVSCHMSTILTKTSVPFLISATYFTFTRPYIITKEMLSVLDFWPAVTFLRYLNL